MKIEFINNSGITTLGTELSLQSKSCHSFNIASAFITKEAITVLKIFLQKNRNADRTGRLITGIYHRFNSQEILQELQLLSKDSKGRLQVKISKNRKFHCKYYDFLNIRTRSVYIGSSNFTNSGMYNTGELQTRITSSPTDKLFNQNCDQFFSTEWENAVNILDFPVNKYKSLKLPKVTDDNLHPDIIKILSERDKEISTNELLPVRVVKIASHLSNSTVKKISLNQSHWDKNDWNYFNCWTKREFDNFKTHDFIFIINKEANQYYFELAIISDKCSLQTKDGNYFVAYKRSKYKKPTKDFLLRLKNINIKYLTRKNYDKKLTQKQAIEITRAFTSTKK